MTKCNMTVFHKPRNSFAGVLLLGLYLIIVIIGFNERGSQGEMMTRGTISQNWFEV